MTNNKIQKRNRRHLRVRAKVAGTAERPRLSVFRSHVHLHLQLIDDTSSRTLVAASSQEITGKMTKTETATAVGKLLAEKAVKVGVKSAVFDRGGNRYHGRVKAAAEAARSGGLNI